MDDDSERTSKAHCTQRSELPRRREEKLAKICFPLADSVPTSMHVADVRGLEALVIRLVLAADSAIFELRQAGPTSLQTRLKLIFSSCPPQLFFRPLAVLLRR